VNRKEGRIGANANVNVNININNNNNINFGVAVNAGSGEMKRNGSDASERRFAGLLRGLEKAATQRNAMPCHALSRHEMDPFSRVRKPRLWLCKARTTRMKMRRRKVSGTP